MLGAFVVLHAGGGPTCTPSDRQEVPVADAACCRYCIGLYSIGNFLLFNLFVAIVLQNFDFQV